ncbi:SDR family oxidoreductase [Novosphingobium album (ex Hu et al. 2023)]|uniref:SDR family oxidoreductase n=1 Tax=Novosphingobium album (ex Hu et al. 2023) TaxID=2930093 RepID=A0ABT0B1J0_9SPHN|nr:SDR family oxidoreductase [Novosphingobium album (ex Hu et al. 2023)]MCJ2178771.1 SDR family oxidoreductase [Novosphingobium album (ex Hu et al. 2023)]
MNDFEAKNVLVLGGSRGIGAAIVRRFAASGANVGFTYAGSKQAAEELAAETGATALRTDSADRSELTATVAARGALDAIVIAAGTLVLGDPLQIDADAVDHMIDVNVRAPYHAAVEAARRMNDNGRIIVIGSVNGDRMPFAGGAAYALTKSAVQGMVRGLARDLGERGITVNSIQPGPTDSDMNPADGPMAATMHSFMAIKRHARTEEVAELAAYLAGPHGAMITGSMQTIDGGFGA